MKEPAKYWRSPVPESCEACGEPIRTIFCDMMLALGRPGEGRAELTLRGPWACLCPRCAYLGPGIGRLGEGKGQAYERQADGRWRKSADPLEALYDRSLAA